MLAFRGPGRLGHAGDCGVFLMSSSQFTKMEEAENARDKADQA